MRNTDTHRGDPATQPGQEANHPRSEVKVTAAKLGLIAALWLIAVNLGALGSMDTELRLRMAHAWWSGEPEVNPSLPGPISREQIEYGIVGVSGQRIIFYDPGQSLLMLPEDWLASRLASHFKAMSPRNFRAAFVTWTLFLPLNVAVVICAFWVLLRFDVAPRLAALSSLVWLLATTVLPYAQVAFQNNQVLLCVLLAHAAILEWGRGRRDRFLLLSGFATALALLFRASAAIHVLTIALFLLVVVFTVLPSNRDRVRSAGWWIVGFLPLAIAGRAFDYLRYGGMLTTGQSLWLRNVNTDTMFAGLPRLPDTFPFTNSMAEGILGVLFSPAKSIFLYDPLLLACLVLVVLTWRSFGPFTRWYILLMGLNLLLHMGLTSRLDFWHGDWAWAARYHVTSIDLLLLPILPRLLQLALSGNNPRAWLSRLCIGFGLATQALAVAMPFGAEIAVEDIVAHPNCDQETWDTARGFRLGNRVTNLYCVLGTGLSRVCEEPTVVKEARAKPACTDELAVLARNTRLAFFPYHPSYRTAAPRLSLAIWGLAGCLAIGLSFLWGRALIAGRSDW